MPPPHDDDFAAGLETPPCAGIVNRRTYLPERAAGRRVVHLGCVDDRLAEARLADGSHLHARLAEVAEELVGVDLSAAGLADLAEVVPGRYLQGDVEDMAAIGLPERCDLVIAGEIIEHLRHPGRFLDGLAGYLAATGAVALLTTPNAYSWTGYVKLLATGREPTHPDHVAMYSPVTLDRLLRASDLAVVALRAHNWEPGPGVAGRVRGLVDRVALRRDPWLAVGIVAEVAAATSR